MTLQTLHETLQQRSKPSKRAVDVEDLLQWAYADWCVDVALRRADAEQFVLSGSNAATVQRVGMLGALVDGGGSACAAGAVARMVADLPEDAAAVHGLVRELPGDMAAVVVRHASKRSRPEWFAGVEVRCVPVMERGRPGVEVDRTSRRAVFCLVGWEPCSPREIEAAREAYSR